MDELYELKEKLCRELQEYVGGDITAGSLQTIDLLTHSIKSLVTIIAMEEGGYSNDGSYDGYNGGGMNGGSYNSYRGYSGRRGRDSMGRYTSGRRYSREEGVSMLSQEIERLMDDAKNPEEREVLKQAHQKLKQMM